jgi:hypothetical protein
VGTHCRRLHVLLIDGTMHSADFDFRDEDEDSDDE